MSYTEKLTALHKGLTPIWADQDRINFAPQLREDIRILTKNTGSTGENIYFNFNKVYTADDPYFSDLAGTVWTVSDIDGWWNVPDLEMPNIQRGYADGSFDVDGRFVARDLEFQGSVVITSGNRSDIGQLNFAIRNHIIALFDLVRRGTWLIVDEDALIPNPDYPTNSNSQYLDYKRACYVRLSGRPEIVTNNSRGRIDFSIGLRANDPLKYEWVENIENLPDFEVITGNGYNFGFVQGTVPSSEFRTYTNGVPDWEQSSALTTDNLFRDYSEVGVYDSGYVDGYRNYSGDVSVSSQQSENGVSAINHGNANVGCYIRVIGPLYGPAEITNITTGQTMTILETGTANIPVIPADTFLDIDTRIREVHQGDFINGESDESARGLLEPLVDWIYLQPGENILYLTDFGSVGVTPVLQVYWRSGWIG
jgi:hypothetical protein